MMNEYGIHWFRRDLRVAGNEALQRQFQYNNGRVLGLFCFDKTFLSRPDFSVNRFHFFLKTLVALKKELNLIGSDLLVLDAEPLIAINDLFDKIRASKKRLPSYFSWSRDYEPFAVERDLKVSGLLDTQGVSYFKERDHLLIEPEELTKKDGEGYQVYTPFSRKWLELFQLPKIQARIESQRKSLIYFKKLKSKKIEKIFNLKWIDIFNKKSSFPDSLGLYLDLNSKLIDIEVPEAGSLEAFNKLEKFIKISDDYGKYRDFPAEKMTSGLSIYLKNGSLTVTQIIAAMNLEYYSKKESGRSIYFSELIWREFYYHTLARNPRIELESFIEKYKNLKWENNKKYFNAWKNGLTGFPIVDAGMRQLNQTGWMHNRVRMIVASFLTKDLLIDWRWGERYFMEKLLDGDLAANNGGWQWAASTGCDPQPYFRIFNPWLQSKKFDPNGIYIKKFIPELQDIKTKLLHAPITDHPHYPAPIVDHKLQREQALFMYKR